MEGGAGEGSPDASRLLFLPLPCCCAIYPDGSIFPFTPRRFARNWPPVKGGELRACVSTKAAFGAWKVGSMGGASIRTQGPVRPQSPKTWVPPLHKPRAPTWSHPPAFPRPCSQEAPDCLPRGFRGLWPHLPWSFHGGSLGPMYYSAWSTC